MRQLHADRLLEALQRLAVALGARALGSVTERVEDVAGRLGGGAGKGASALLSAVPGVGGDSSAGGRSAIGNAISAFVKTKLTQAPGKNQKGGKMAKGAKVTNIVESIDVGVPLRVAYNQWTQFKDFPSFMKKVESVEQESDEKLNWKAQILWSHRTWESDILEQVPDKRIIWRSKGAKGYVDGTVTFHELAPELTRIMLVLEYHPQGFFEGTANLWRAQGRRVRLEIKHFRRHVMRQTILNPDEVEGWRGEIRDGEVVKDHEAALREEQEGHEGEEPEDEYGDEYEHEGGEEEEEREPERRPARSGRRREPSRGGREPSRGGGREPSRGGRDEERPRRPRRPSAPRVGRR